MWYVLWTEKGDEKNISIVKNFVDHSLFKCCIVSYRRKQKIYKNVSIFVEKVFSLYYVFIETDRIIYLVQRIQYYPGKQIILSTENCFCPICEEEDYFLLDNLDENDIIDSYNGYMDRDCVRMISGSLRKCVDRIKNVIREKNFAI